MQGSYVPLIDTAKLIVNDILRSMPKQSTAMKIARITVDQWGLVTRQQARHAGIPPATLARMIASGTLERITQGVYLAAGSPRPSHLELRAAYLQLEPGVPAWRRVPSSGVVSHRSAASLYDLGHLTADVHEFTFETRRQTRLDDVRLHKLPLEESECITLQGMFVTRPSRIVADLLRENEDFEAVAQITVEAIREVKDYLPNFVVELNRVATRAGEDAGNGRAVLRRLVDVAGDEELISQFEIFDEPMAKRT